MSRGLIFILDGGEVSLNRTDDSLRSIIRCDLHYG